MNLSALLTHHPFWGLLTLAVLVWYASVTVYVAFRGIRDIRNMLHRLREGAGPPAAARSAGSPGERGVRPS